MLGPWPPPPRCASACASRPSVSAPDPCPSAPRPPPAAWSWGWACPLILRLAWRVLGLSLAASGGGRQERQQADQGDPAEDDERPEREPPPQRLADGRADRCAEHGGGGQPGEHRRHGTPLSSRVDQFRGEDRCDPQKRPVGHRRHHPAGHDHGIVGADRGQDVAGEEHARRRQQHGATGEARAERGEQRGSHGHAHRVGALEVADVADRHAESRSDLLHDSGDDELVGAHREGADHQRPHRQRHAHSACRWRWSGVDGVCLVVGASCSAVVVGMRFGDRLRRWLHRRLVRRHVNSYLSRYPSNRSPAPVCR